MGAAQTALLALAGALAGAAEPQSVSVLTDPLAAPSGAVDVRPSALTRLGRSQRDGPILDLELLARVVATGPDAVETTERMLIALEREGRYAVEPLPEPGLGFQVRVRVAVRLDEAVGPPVLEPLRLDVRPARVLVGIVLDAAGHGVPDAVVRAEPGGPSAASDPEGRFRVLAWEAPTQRFVVEVDGATRTVDAATDTAPVVIRWE